MVKKEKVHLGMIYYSELENEYVIPVEEYEYPDLGSGLCYTIEPIGKDQRERYIESTLFFQHYRLVDNKDDKDQTR